LGGTYRALKNFEKGVEYHEASLVIAREFGDRRSEGNSLGNLGYDNFYLGNRGKAEDFLREAIKIFEEIESPSAEIIREWLAKLESNAVQL
jgi:tetratricopeptide (TPR) repeat protein